MTTSLNKPTESIKDILKKSRYLGTGVGENVTDPISDFIDDELEIIVKDIKINKKEEEIKNIDGVELKKKPIKGFTRKMIEDVPVNYRKWWKKEELLRLYQGLKEYGYNLDLLVRHMNYTRSRSQIQYKIKSEEKIRPHLIKRCMLN